LIVAAPGGYHILLAGLVRLYADLGQDVKMGEPIGELGDEGSRAQLYLEVRQHGKPVDPIPFLAARDGKVSG
jgi:septal ring factor EnvC (AmiA/AmiB activator)